MISQVDTVLGGIQEITGLDVTVDERDPARGPLRADALVTVASPAGRSRYVAHARQSVTTSTLPAVTSQLDRYARHFGRAPLLLARHLTPGVTERLVAEGFEFADRPGNIYLSGPAAYVLVLGRKADREPRGRSTSGLTATALRLVYALLADPSLWKATYRELREATGISLGKISGTFAQLEEAGYVATTRTGARRPVEPVGLLSRWEFGYLEQLRPTLQPSRWALRGNDRVGGVPSQLAGRGDVLIGGEYAAALQTGYLEPATITLHVPRGATNEVAVGLRLRPDVDMGTVTVLERFVPPHEGRPAPSMASDRSPGADRSLAHPILVRAELLVHDDPRLRKTARRLLEEHIQPQLMAHART